MKALPVIPKATPEIVIFNLNWLAAAGTSILIAVLLTAIFLKVTIAELSLLFRKTFDNS